jgi:hypothetical protein
MAQSTNDGGNSDESPFDIGSCFSTPFSSPARKLADGEGKEEEDYVELGAVTKFHLRPIFSFLTNQGVLEVSNGAF